jgi:hypothetical protein
MTVDYTEGLGTDLLDLEDCSIYPALCESTGRSTPPRSGTRLRVSTT